MMTIDVQKPKSTRGPLLFETHPHLMMIGEFLPRPKTLPIDVVTGSRCNMMIWYAKLASLYIRHFIRLDVFTQFTSRDRIFAYW